MVTKVKVPAKLAPVRPATTWPFPTPGISEPNISKIQVAVKNPTPTTKRVTAPDNKKHVVMATLHNVELAKAKSALSLDLYANGKKIGNLEVGQGSFFWTGARRKKSKPIDWTRFAAMMNQFAYEEK